MELITKAQAAEMLTISESSLSRLIQRGALPAYRVGARIVRLDRADVEAYVKGRQTRVVQPKRRAVAEPAVRPCTYVPGMKVV